jgi:hypothetical protein
MATIVAISAVVNESDPRFRVAPSTLPAAGQGLFANTRLEAGDRLEIIGVLVERDSISDACTHFADEHKVRVGDRLLLIPLGFGGMANHSADPNMEKVIEGDRAYLQALRTIEPGEEVFFRYTEYAQERFGLR